MAKPKSQPPAGAPASEAAAPEAPQRLLEDAEDVFRALPVRRDARGTANAWVVHAPVFEAERHVPDMALTPWAGHRRFAYDLTCFVRPRRVVELGVFLGTSLFAFAQAVKDSGLAADLIGVDTWEGDVHGGFYGDDIYATALRIREDCYGPLPISLVRQLFAEAAKLVDEESIDILHIDGLHTYEAASADFQLWLPKLAPDGVVLFHDVETTFTVSRLWREIREQHPSFGFKHSYGLGILFPKGARVFERMRRRGFPEALPIYEVHSRHDRARTRLRFAEAGARRDKAYIAEMEQRHAERDQTIARMGGEQEQLRREIAERDERAKTLVVLAEEQAAARARLERRVAELAAQSEQAAAAAREQAEHAAAAARLAEEERSGLARELEASRALLATREDLRSRRRQDGALDPEAALPYFVVYGPDYLDHIRARLLPALAAQETRHPREVFFLNYLENRPLLGSDDSRPGLAVHDVSALRAPGRLGFGAGVNTLFELVQPPTVFLVLNPDTVPRADFSRTLLAAFDPAHTGVAEGRQWPAEHPKEFDVETGETPWASGACFLVSSDAFHRIGGFDPAFFLYCEDVDLSWRMWLSGRRVVYVRDAVSEHHTGMFSYHRDRFYAEQYYSAIGFLLLSYKFFGKAGEERGRRWLEQAGYPKSLHERLLGHYERARAEVTPLPVAPVHPRIKILGFNRYHELRTA